ncbi:tetratricopeptide repeat protein [Chthoniobacter sp.]|uniref:O-linked N-acetylglucosamine transferase, SPINDLY family protein n=1 Tax=Chthoniobacter sp. TaxID=2510640 RepID=UPI0032AFBD96
MPTVTVQQAFELALQHHQAGRLAEAETLYRQILAVQPHHADALHFLGVIAHQAGRHDLAVEWIRGAIALDPNNPVSHCNLGEAYRATGRLDEAIASFHRSLQFQPNDSKTHNNLGIALALQGRMDEASFAFRRALQLQPDQPGVHNNLGNALREQGQLDEAISAYRRALHLQPGYADAHHNLGNALKDQGELCEAVASYHRALQLKPGQVDWHDSLILTLYFLPNDGGRMIAEAQQCWNRLVSEPLQGLILSHTNDRDPGRRLRIGYVSAAFRDHVVGRNILPLLQCHDHQSFEILCYSGVAHADKFTEEFRRHADQWRGTVGVSDEVLAEMIRRDGVDILVDLSQHTEGNRLPMFARQPAPVQVSFAGYPDGAGVDAIGYRISDRYLEAGDSEVSGEQMMLIDSFWCYSPCGADVEVNALPARENGFITFGSLNNFCKVNEAVLRLWAGVLARVPQSHLVLLSGVGSHRQRILEFLEREGIEVHRVEFAERRLHRAYLELYHRLDIVLDPFPYNGHTTSLDALWMGVPVVSLAGERAISRAGLSQLSNLGLPELIAQSEDDYVAIATQLGGDLPRLAELRATLRGRMETSVLMDAPRFARSIEAVYRTLWQQWCRR